jgi:hypothetical protein
MDVPIVCSPVRAFGSVYTFNVKIVFHTPQCGSRRYDSIEMSVQALTEAVNSLSPEQQTSVLEFISYLKRIDTSTTSPFVQAAEQFMANHPELLQRLAQ